jgi:chromosome segregation ATPase
MELKTIAELDQLHDELLKKSAALQQELSVLQQRIDALKATQRKPKRAEKQFTVLLEIRKKSPARIPPPDPRLIPPPKTITPERCRYGVNTP